MEERKGGKRVSDFCSAHFLYLGDETIHLRLIPLLRIKHLFDACAGNLK